MQMKMIKGKFFVERQSWQKQSGSSTMQTRRVLILVERINKVTIQSVLFLNFWIKPKTNRRAPPGYGCYAMTGL